MNLPLSKFQNRLVWDECLKAWTLQVVQKSVLATFDESFENGCRAYDNGQFELAIKNFSEAIQSDPTHSIAYYNRGICKSNLNQNSNAVVDFSESIRLDPEHKSAFQDRGFCNFKLHQYTEAITDYSVAIRLNPKDDSIIHARGHCKLVLKQYIEAIEDLSEAILLNPNDARTYNNRGFCQAQLEQHTEAIADYTEAVRLDPPCVVAYFNRGVSYSKIENQYASIEDYCLSIPFSMGLLNSKQNYAPVEDILKFRTIDSNLLNSLKNREIWFAHSRTFNDADDGEYLRKLFPENQFIANLLGKILMFSCFGNSSNSQNTQSQENEKQQMWAHYAAESAGICLHFKYSPEAAQNGNLFMLDSVKYSDDIKFDENQSQYDVIRHGFFTKSTAWKSENEYRFITILNP